MASALLPRHSKNRGMVRGREQRGEAGGGRHILIIDQEILLVLTPSALDVQITNQIQIQGLPESLQLERSH